MQKIAIYCPKNSTRLNYVLNEIFQRQLKVNYELLHDLKAFTRCSIPKINYSNQFIENTLHIQPHSLLFENDIKVQELKTGMWEGIPVIFANRNEHIPFDLYAATFYLLSRYEEYIPSKRDRFGRFCASNSILYRLDVMQKPVVEIWLQLFKTLFISQFPNFQFPIKKFRFIPTFDVDNAYAFLHKGFFRTSASILKKMVSGQFAFLRLQLQVLAQRKNDPFDTFKFIHDVHHQYSIEPMFFFLVGKYNKYDTNISVKNRHFQQLIQDQASHTKVALHPSTRAHLNINRLEREKEYLEKLINKEIKKSRNHFLLLRIPQTYETLIKAGIKEDFSMGYSEINGFRAGISSPFTFYHLKQEQEVDLTIHPFAFMDATFQYYTKLTIDKALQEMQIITDEVKAVQGQLISLWHNESLSNFREWQGWKDGYKKLTAYILS